MPTNEVKDYAPDEDPQYRQTRTTYSRGPSQENRKVMEVTKAYVVRTGQYIYTVIRRLNT